MLQEAVAEPEDSMPLVLPDTNNFRLHSTTMFVRTNDQTFLFFCYRRQSQSLKTASPWCCRTRTISGRAARPSHRCR